MCFFIDYYEICVKMSFENLKKRSLQEVEQNKQKTSNKSTMLVTDTLVALITLTL